MHGYHMHGSTSRSITRCFTIYCKPFFTRLKPYFSFFNEQLVMPVVVTQSMTFSMSRISIRFNQYLQTHLSSCHRNERFSNELILDIEQRLVTAVPLQPGDPTGAPGAPGGTGAPGTWWTRAASSWRASRSAETWRASAVTALRIGFQLPVLKPTT